MIRKMSFSQSWLYNVAISRFVCLFIFKQQNYKWQKTEGSYLKYIQYKSLESLQPSFFLHVYTLTLPHSTHSDTKLSCRKQRILLFSQEIAAISRLFFRARKIFHLLHLQESCSATESRMLISRLHILKPLQRQKCILFAFLCCIVITIFLIAFF